jgi:hypothetical protein
MPREIFITMISCIIYIYRFLMKGLYESFDGSNSVQYGLKLFIIKLPAFFNQLKLNKVKYICKTNRSLPDCTKVIFPMRQKRHS